MLYVHQTHLCRQLGKKHEETSQNNPDSLKKGKYNRMKWWYSNTSNRGRD